MKQGSRENNESVPTVTDYRSETNETQNTRQSGSKTNMSIRVHACNIADSDLEEDDYPLRASNMCELNNPAKPFHQDEQNLDETMLSNEDSEEEYYHKNRLKDEASSSVKINEIPIEITFSVGIFITNDTFRNELV